MVRVMKIAAIPIIVLLMFAASANILLLHFGTFIGQAGHRNTVAVNLCFITVAVLLLLLGVISGVVLHKKAVYCVLVLLCVGIAMFIIGAVGMRDVVRETSDKPVTAEMSDIRIESATGGRDKRLEGTVDGEHIYFMLRGKDRFLAQQIEKSRPTHIKVVYYPSTRRIESVTW